VLGVPCGRVPDDAGLLRLVHRRTVFAVQPRLVGGAAVGRGLPRQSRGLQQGLRSIRRAAAWCRCRHSSRRATSRAPQADGAVQRFPRGEDHRQSADGYSSGQALAAMEAVRA
jgi:hypothetical protein